MTWGDDDSSAFEGSLTNFGIEVLDDFRALFIDTGIFKLVTDILDILLEEIRLSNFTATLVGS